MFNLLMLGLTLWLPLHSHAVSRRDFLKNSGAAVVHSALPSSSFHFKIAAPGTSIPTLAETYGILLSSYPWLANVKDTEALNESVAAVWKDWRNPMQTIREISFSMDMLKMWIVLKQKVALPSSDLGFIDFAQLEIIEKELSLEFGLTIEQVRGNLRFINSVEPTLKEAFGKGMNGLKNLSITNEFIESYLTRLGLAQPQLALVATVSLASSHESEMLRALGLENTHERMSWRFRGDDLPFEAQIPVKYKRSSARLEFEESFGEPENSDHVKPDMEVSYETTFTTLKQAAQRISELPDSIFKMRLLAEFSLLDQKLRQDIITLSERRKVSQYRLEDHSELPDLQMPKTLSLTRQDEARSNGRKGAPSEFQTATTDVHDIEPAIEVAAPNNPCKAALTYQPKVHLNLISDVIGETRENENIEKPNALSADRSIQDKN